jgi:hypothetical protein
MSGVFQNIDPPPPSKCVSPPPSPALVREKDTLDGEGGGASIVCKTPGTALVLYICKYFVTRSLILSAEEQASYNQSLKYIFP